MSGYTGRRPVLNGPEGSGQPTIGAKPRGWLAQYFRKYLDCHIFRKCWVFGKSSKITNEIYFQICCFRLCRVVALLNKFLTFSNILSLNPAPKRLCRFVTQACPVSAGKPASLVTEGLCGAKSPREVLPDLPRIGSFGPKHRSVAPQDYPLRG